MFFTGAAAVVGGVAPGMWWFGKDGMSCPTPSALTMGEAQDLNDAV